MNEARDYMATNPNEKLNNDEAKYIFFWGMDMWFDKDTNEEEQR